MTNEIEIGSSHGQVYVFTDGTISRFTDDAENEFGIDGIGITKFDLSVEALEDGFADILNVGYWHANGYEPAFTEDDWGGVAVLDCGPVIEGQTIGDKFGDQS